MAVQGEFVVRGASVFDGEQVVDADAVLVSGGRIIEVGRDLTCPPGTAVVDADGLTLLPGLIDGHTHTPPGERGRLALAQSLAFGVTTVICLGADPHTTRHLKVLASQRSDLADIRSAGWCATVPGGHPTHLSDEPYPTLSGPDDAVRFVAAHQAAGMDHVKVVLEDGATIGRSLPCAPPEVVHAITAEAHRRGLLVVAHAVTERLALQALDAGADVLAHQYIDRPQSKEIATRLHDTGTYVCLTLACYRNEEGAQFARDPRVFPYMQRDWLKHLATALTPREPLATYATSVLDAVPVLNAAGVRIIAGTDAPNPGTGHGVSLHHELSLLVLGGLTPGQALAAATSTAADCYRLPDRGRIRSGQRADLVLVEGDPLTDIDCTLNITRVWRSGRAYVRERRP